jgi:proline dehydrogenase
MLRNLMLRMAANPALVRGFSRLGRTTGLTRRFIAGESFQDALSTVREFNRLGLSVTLDLLGEGITDGTEADRAAGAYRRLLEKIHQSGVRSSISIKLTQLGLEIETEACRRNLHEILRRAQSLDNFVRIDMEDSRFTQTTIDLFLESYEEFGRHVGIVLQSYLRRSERDARELSAKGCNVRLCKGAYMEPPEIAFPRKADVDENFKRMLEILLTSAGHAAIATHDEAMIQHALGIVRTHGVPRSKYEFQMLYGVRRERQLDLQGEGHRVRVYVPFGTQWAQYFMRRLAERPANLLFIFKSIFRR